MAWYSSSWKYRRAITIDATGPASTVDVEAAIPATDDEFWSNVNASGDDIVVTAADGITPLTYDLASFNTNTRTGTIEIDGMAVTAGFMVNAFVYWGNSGATNSLTTFSPSSAVTGAIEFVSGAPVFTVRATRERPGATTPRRPLSKGSAEQIYVDFDFSDLLELLPPGSAYEGHLAHEEIAHLSSFQVLLSGVDQTAMYTTTAHRFLPYGRVRCLVKAGSSGSDYTLVCSVVTSRPGSSITRTLTARAALRVRDVAE